MHREWIFKQLADYEPSEDSDREAALRAYHFIKHNPECFDRSLLKGHVTGSCWLLNFDQSKALMTYHRKLKKWIQLGGHADGEVNVLEVAMKEAKEESGILAIQPVSDQLFDVDVHFIPPHGSDPAHFHYDFRYLFWCTDDSNPQISEESIALKWFDIDGLHPLQLEPSIQRLIRKWAAKRGSELLRNSTLNMTQAKDQPKPL